MPATAKSKAKTADLLLAAIIADPDDDTARLAYADFLEENDEAQRAEFIRVQVELAHLSPWERKAKLLRFRERLLLIHHGEEWRNRLPQLAGVTWGKFERGFISEVSVDDVKVLAKRAETIREVSPVTGIRLISPEGIGARSVKAYPWLRSLRVLIGVATPQFTSSPLVEHLTRLVCEGASITNDTVDNIAASAALAGLQELEFPETLLTDQGAAALAKAPHLTGLRVLRFRLANAGDYTADPHISQAGIRALANSPHLTNLRTLDLGNQRFTDSAVRAVLTSPTFAKLETVCFSGAALTAKAFEVAPSATRLRDVDLHNSLIGDAGAAALAKAPQFSKVCVLRLRACEIGAKGIAAMAHSPLAAGIQELDIADNPLRSSGIEEFSRGRWPELHTLSLASCGIGADTVKSLQTADGVGKLIDLDLSGNEVGAAGAIAASRAKWSGQLVRLNLAHCRCAAGAVLANSDRFRHLQYLDLTDNPLNPAGLEALMASEWLVLTDLRLSGSLAGDEGAKILARSEAFGRLVTLSMNRCGLTPEGLAALLAGRGSVASTSRLVQLDLSRNLELGDEAINLLIRSAPPALRFLSIAGIGLTPEGLPRLVGTPLLARLSRLDFHANEPPVTKEPPPELPEELREIDRRPLPPDLEAAGLPIKTT